MPLLFVPRPGRAILRALLACAIIFNTTAILTRPTKSMVIMLDPAGDAQHTGRLIDDSFERGIALQCAEELKLKIESITNNTRVILTRFPGETLEPLQSAEFSNRMQADLFISLHLYQEVEDAPRLSIFAFSYDPMASFMHRNLKRLTLLPYDQAYQRSRATTQRYTELFKKAVQTSSQQPLRAIQGPYSFPFKPLIGVEAPSFSLELGIAHKDSWRSVVGVLANGVAKIADKYQNNRSVQ